MIDWTKPIETVDGRKAKVLSSISPVGSDDPAGWAVYGAAPPGGVFGHVFLVDAQGFRCDDDAPIQRQQIIRNVRVKREGWGRVNSNNGLPFTIGDIVFSEKASAESACQKLGGIPAFITWEE